MIAIDRITIHEVYIMNSYLSRVFHDSFLKLDKHIPCMLVCQGVFVMNYKIYFYCYFGERFTREPLLVIHEVSKAAAIG